jgi:hypothetical protein
MLHIGDTLEVTLTGTCMEPILVDGQRILVRKQGRYYPGDIIVFADGSGNLLVHRYLGPAPRGRVMTRADTSDKIDVPAPSERVLGRAISAESAVIAVGAVARCCATFHYVAWVTKLACLKVARQVGAR